MKSFKLFELVDQQIGRKIIDTKWVFKGKKDEAGNVTKYKQDGSPSVTCKTVESIMI